MEHYLFIILYAFSLLVLSLFGLHKYFLLYTFKKFKKQKYPVPVNPDTWPEVTVQLPIFNERYVIKRLLKSVVLLDYPREKLKIQVLDDSTDITFKITDRLVRLLRKKGYQVEHLRRGTRIGYKAGALEYGLKQSKSEFLAVFDADFVPNPDFLKKTIPHFNNPKIGMVQVRWGHINRNYSLLTRLQAIFLDAHFIIEHFARDRSGRFFNFNGTAGVWRRKAILDAGGWQHDTLTEDLDLSYRSQLAGWKFLYLPDVVAPAELPADMNAYKSQQHRWAKGSVQTALKLIPTILKAKLPFYIRLEAIIHLSNNFAYLLMTIPAILIIPVLKYQIQSELWWPVFFYLFVFFAATFSVIVYYSAALKESQGKVWPNILLLPFLISLGIGLSINNGRAALEAIFGKQSEFVRTPKFRLEGERRNKRKKWYRTKKTDYYYLELLFGLYFTLGMVYFLIHGYFYSLPFFVLFQFGFLYLAISSITSDRT